MTATEGTSTIPVTTRSGLREIYGPPLEVAVKCRLPKLDKHHRRFIARSPFICIATASRDGTPSVSPKGDAPGFVRVVDDSTLIIPDRPGNNQLATLSNLTENDKISLIFFVPGIEETLRVVGQAQIVRDPATLQMGAVSGRLPRSAIRVTVTTAFIHCGKAMRRSKLWDQTHHARPGEVPTLAEMTKDQARTAESVEELDSLIKRDYESHLY